MKKERTNNLFDIRKSKHITADKLAEKTGIPTITIRSYELDINDLKKAQFHTIVDLCEALDCKFADLFIETDFKKRVGKH